MLVDRGCDQTIVDPEKVDYSWTTHDLCVHGHIEFYLTTMVWLEIGGEEREQLVVVAPQLPMPVLLG